MRPDLPDEFLDLLQEFLGTSIRSLSCYDGNGQQHDMTPEVREQYDDETLVELLSKQEKLYQNIIESGEKYAHGDAKFTLIGYEKGLEIIIMPDKEDLKTVQIGVEKDPFKGSSMQFFINRCIEALSK